MDNDILYPNMNYIGVSRYIVRPDLDPKVRLKEPWSFLESPIAALPNVGPPSAVPNPEGKVRFA